MDPVIIERYQYNITLTQLSTQKSVDASFFLFDNVAKNTRASHIKFHLLLEGICNVKMYSAVIALSKVINTIVSFNTL